MHSEEGTMPKCVGAETFWLINYIMQSAACSCFISYALGPALWKFYKGLEVKPALILALYRFKLTPHICVCKLY